MRHLLIDRRQPGQAMAEMSLIIGLFLLVIMGGLTYLGFTNDAAVVTRAAGEGANAASLSGGDVGAVIVSRPHGAAGRRAGSDARIDYGGLAGGPGALSANSGPRDLHDHGPGRRLLRPAEGAHDRPGLYPRLGGGRQCEHWPPHAAPARRGHLPGGAP